MDRHAKFATIPQGSWICMGDYNTLLTGGDKIHGTNVQECKNMGFPTISIKFKHDKIENNR